MIRLLDKLITPPFEFYGTKRVGKPTPEESTHL